MHLHVHGQHEAGRGGHHRGHGTLQSRLRHERERSSGRLACGGGRELVHQTPCSGIDSQQQQTQHRPEAATQLATQLLARAARAARACSERLLLHRFVSRAKQARLHAHSKSGVKGRVGDESQPSQAAPWGFAEGASAHTRAASAAGYRPIVAQTRAAAQLPQTSRPARPAPFLVDAGVGSERHPRRYT